jgi:hypothetical protein
MAKWEVPCELRATTRTPDRVGPPCRDSLAASGFSCSDGVARQAGVGLFSCSALLRSCFGRPRQAGFRAVERYFGRPRQAGFRVVERYFGRPLQAGFRVVERYFGRPRQAGFRVVERSSVVPGRRGFVGFRVVERYGTSVVPGRVSGC